MAVIATDLALHDGVAVREVKTAAQILMALKANLRGLSGVDNGLVSAARFLMFAAGAVARLASRFGCIGAHNLEPGMAGCFEISGDFLVAIGA